MQHKITVTLLTVSLIFLLGSSEARSFSQSHVIRDLPDDAKDYLADLYNRFNVVFQAKYRKNSESTQFAVATINEPDNLQPCPLVMNEDQGTISSSNNYLAYTPRPSPTRPNGQQHAEIRIILSYPDATSGVTVSAVFLVTHFSPCKYCSDALQSFVRNNEAVKFYIGYVERYQNEDNLNYFIKQVGNEPNVQYGKITPSQQVCSQSSTCPVQCGSVVEQVEKLFALASWSKYD